ncbi:MAG: Bd3614 family nucleic acid deaminase [Alphaproteobacteria bacterium]|nr:Bd3614 family nucleic acid deaminase [Alphaproteobacteria bacterium]
MTSSRPPARDAPAEAALLHLAARLHGPRVAVLRDGDTAWWAPSVEALVLGVREAGAGADRALRAPILVGVEPGPSARALVQVGAKRVRVVGAVAGPVSALTWRAAGPWAGAARRRAAASAQWLSGEDPWEAVGRLEAAARRTGPRWRQDLPVAAVLVDGEGRAVLGARNLGGSNRVLHAERVLLEAWRAAGRGPIPAGWRLCVGLTPCRMCAAALVDAATGPLDVVVAREDPGRLARHTALQASGWERPRSSSG